MDSPTSADNDGAAAVDTYELFCTDCEYETSVQGSVYEALDVADAHQEEHGDSPRDHFVTFKLRGLER